MTFGKKEIPKSAKMPLIAFFHPVLYIQYHLIVQVLECRVCEEVFSLHGDKIPRLLFCGHTLCHTCLTKLAGGAPTQQQGFLSVIIVTSLFSI